MLAAFFRYSFRKGYICVCGAPANHAIYPDQRSLARRHGKRSIRTTRLGWPHENRDHTSLEYYWLTGNRIKGSRRSKPQIFRRSSMMIGSVNRKSGVGIGWSKERAIVVDWRWFWWGRAALLNRNFRIFTQNTPYKIHERLKKTQRISWQLSILTYVRNVCRTAERRSVAHCFLETKPQTKVGFTLSTQRRRIFLFNTHPEYLCKIQQF